MPLSSLKDPASFAPPPKHRGVYGADAGTPGSPARSNTGGGLGAPVPVSRSRQQEVVEEEAPKPPPQPYRKDTTGINTTNMPKPPARRVDGASPTPPPRSAASPPLPVRQNTTQRAPPPFLPPRQNEYPDEHTAPPPPTYNEATKQPVAQDPAAINAGAASRLAQAGVNVSGFGIGSNNAANAAPSQSSATTQGHPSQLSELQSRFSRLGAASTGQASPPPTPSSSNAPAAVQKKPPPPPPPKKAGLAAGGVNRSDTAEGSDQPAPPPLPLASKPRPA